ncbi:MAG: ZIP family metal transporter [Thermoguttaceae bacterium]
MRGRADRPFPEVGAAVEAPRRAWQSPPEERSDGREAIVFPTCNQHKDSPRMSPTVLLSVYCVLILVASLAGGWIPLVVRLTHRRMQIAASLVAGVMLGVGILHLLPHALLEAPDAINTVFLWVLGGFLVMFFVERFFCFHHHDVPAVGNEPAERVEAAHSHHENCQHVRSESHELTWSGAAVGLMLHTVFNGIALAASVQAESHGGAVAGMGTFLVIFLHKPFDAMTIGTLMAIGGWSAFWRHVVNTIFALMIPAGVLLFYLGFGHAHGESHVLSYALAFSAGTFMCIAMSDLLPELHFHSHDRAALSLALLTGLAIAVAIGVVEGRSHGHSDDSATHEHAGHEHAAPQEPAVDPDEGHEHRDGEHPGHDH